MPNSARNSLRLQANNSPPSNSPANNHLRIITCSSAADRKFKHAKSSASPPPCRRLFCFIPAAFFPFQRLKNRFRSRIPVPLYPLSRFSPFHPFPRPHSARVCAVGLFCPKNVHFSPFVRFSVNCIAADRLFFSCAGVEFSHKQKLSRGGSRSEGGKKAKFMKLRSTKPLRAAKGFVYRPFCGSDA